MTRFRILAFVALLPACANGGMDRAAPAASAEVVAAMATITDADMIRQPISSKALKPVSCFQ